MPPTKDECRKIVDDVLDWATGRCKDLPDLPFIDETKLCKEEIDKNRDRLKEEICKKYVDK